MRVHVHKRIPSTSQYLPWNGIKVQWRGEVATLPEEEITGGGVGEPCDEGREQW